MGPMKYGICEGPNLVGKTNKWSHIIKAFPPWWAGFRISRFFWNLFRWRKIHFHLTQVYSISKNWFNSPINMNWYVFYIWDHFYNIADFLGFSTWLILNDTASTLVSQWFTFLWAPDDFRFSISYRVLLRLFLKGVKLTGK